MKKLLFPSTVKTPIFQYTVEGLFVKKYSSIANAVKEVGYCIPSLAIKEKVINTNAYDPFTTKGIHVFDGWIYPLHNIRGGYIWRYASSNIGESINVFRIRPYTYDENRRYLRTRYETIIDKCYK